MTDAILTVTNLTKRFGALRAVDGLDFTQQRGEILGLIGPNGAGKTTIINLVMGSFAPTDGAIEFQGRPLRGLKPHQRVGLGIARTFQIPQPFRGMSVRENVMLSLLFGRSAPDVRRAAERADEVLSFVDIGVSPDRPADGLTMGQMKRLELAKALANDPQLLLLDEVMAGLNLYEVEFVMDLVRQINQRGVSVLVIEHVMKAIMGISHRIVVLHHGRKIAEGTPESVSQDPAVISAYLGARYAERQMPQAVGTPVEEADEHDA